MKYPLALLCCLFLVGCESIVPSTTSRPPVAYTPQHTFTVPVTPSTIPNPTPTTGEYPHIGETLITWDTYYATSRQDNSKAQQVVHSYRDEVLHAMLAVSFEPTEQNRAFTLTFAPDTPYERTDMDALTIPTLYLPPDSKMVAQQTLTQGIVWTFVSPTLARTFPASFFFDNTGSPVTPGTCVIFYSFDASSQVTHATLSIGAVYGI